MTQEFEAALFCIIFVHIVVVTSESGIPETTLDSSGRKVAAQAFDVLVLLIYLCVPAGCSCARAAAQAAAAHAAAQLPRQALSRS